MRLCGRRSSRCFALFSGCFGTNWHDMGTKATIGSTLGAGRAGAAARVGGRLGALEPWSRTSHQGLGLMSVVKSRERRTIVCRKTST